MKMSKNQTYLAGGAAAIMVVLLYRWYRSRQEAAQLQATEATQTQPEWASLAGQEQADFAALQSQLNALAEAKAPIATAPSGPDPSGPGYLRWRLANEAGGKFPWQLPHLGAGVPLPAPSSPEVHASNDATGPTLPPGDWLAAVARMNEAGSRMNQIQAGLLPRAPGTGSHLRPVARQRRVPAPSRVHSSSHQAGNGGHVGSHTQGAVAPSDHAPKSPLRFVPLRVAPTVR